MEDRRPSIPAPSPFAEGLSPELVLVSAPSDASWARAQLPDHVPGPEPRPARRPLDRPVRPLCLPVRSIARVPTPPAGEVVAAEGAGRAGRVAQRIASATLLLATVSAVAVVGLPIAGLTPQARPSLVGPATSPPPRAKKGPEGPQPRPSPPPPPSRQQPLAPPPPRLTVGPPSAPRPDAKRSPERPGPIAAVLSWPRVRGARGYLVELASVRRARETVILTFATRLPGLELPKKWENADGPRTLRPGRYRWYVWPDPPLGGDPKAGPIARGGFVVR